MNKVKFFEDYYCPYCKALLPASPHYKNNGMLRVFCSKCGREVIIYKKKIAKDYR